MVPRESSHAVLAVVLGPNVVDLGNRILAILECNEVVIIDQFIVKQTYAARPT